MGGLSFYRRVLQLDIPWRIRAMCTAACGITKAYSDAGKITSASIAAVSPPELVSKTLSLDTDSNTLSVAEHRFKVNK